MYKRNVKLVGQEKGDTILYAYEGYVDEVSHPGGLASSLGCSELDPAALPLFFPFGVVEVPLLNLFSSSFFFFLLRQIPKGAHSLI